MTPLFNWRQPTEQTASILTTEQSNALMFPRHPRMSYKRLTGTLDPLERPPSEFQVIHSFGNAPLAAAPPNPGDVGQFEWGIMTTLFANVVSLLANSVVPSSQKSYRTGWKRWITYTATIGTDRFLQLIPVAFQQYVNQAVQAVQMSWAILACCGYLAYLVSHPVKPTSAPSASNYLSAVRYNLRKFGMDVDFMDTSSFLKAARAGVIRSWRVIPGNSIADRQTLPISIGMIEHAAAQTLNMANLSDMALYTATIFAYTILCRVSEYLERPSSDHHLLSQSVVFWIRHANPAEVTLLSPFLYVPSHDVWQYPKQRLAGVTVTVKDSKADIAGIGDCYPIPRFEGIRPPTMVYEFSEVLFDLAIRARPLVDRPFFSCSTAERLVVSADSMNKWLKTRVAPLFQLNPKRIHTHSLRFAGASALAAAKVPDSVIMKMGRWRSLAFLGYIRLAKEIFAQVAAALANRDIFTITDVRNLMPSV